MSADSPVIELPLIREPRFPRTACYPFARSGLGLISIQRKTSSASCAAALEMPCRYTRCKLRPWTYYCLFGLLSVSGLRLGEARNLKLSDIDFDAAVLTIRGTKFGKSRLVPMHASTCAVLQDYLKRRRQHCAAQAASPYLFTSQLGNRLDVGDIHRTFYALSRQIGLRGATDSHGPRLHDMRHVFATNTLVRWYRSRARSRAAPAHFVHLSRPCPRGRYPMVPQRFTRADERSNAPP